MREWAGLLLSIFSCSAFTGSTGEAKKCRFRIGGAATLMFSVFHRVTQRRAERVWHRVEWLQNGFIGVLGVPRPPLVTFGAAALAEFALLPAAEFGLLLADLIFEVSVSKVFDLEPRSVNCDSARKPFFFKHGFFGRLGKTFSTFNVKIDGTTATSTSPFGCNDEREIVGSFTDSNGNIHGFIFAHRRFFQFDAAGSSQTPAFGVMGTFTNGVSDRGDIVGLFSDGTKVNGFVNFAPPSDRDDHQN
jgi:hypothetical protein